MQREIIKIDDEKCNGCGNCIPNCHEGALQIIDGKAVLVSELMCDGLGACVGHCPEGALEIEVREAETYLEEVVMKEMICKGQNVVTAHLKHLKEHGEFEYLKQGVAYLTENQHSIDFDIRDVIQAVHQSVFKGSKNLAHSIKPGITPMLGNEKGCPGSQPRSFNPVDLTKVEKNEIPSTLTQWPVQMHLINPQASYFMAADLLIAADCVAFALGNFHSKYLSGKKLAIACPKLDNNKESYVEKIISLIDAAKVNTITVMMMEVPCCGGLLQLVLKATESAHRKVPVKATKISIQGEVLSEEWMVPST